VFCPRSVYELQIVRYAWNVCRPGGRWVGASSVCCQVVFGCRITVETGGYIRAVFVLVRAGVLGGTIADPEITS
jgi:hypothetical protein